jgi:hypothetical protein
MDHNVNVLIGRRLRRSYAKLRKFKAIRLLAVVAKPTVSRCHRAKRRHRPNASLLLRLLLRRRAGYTNRDQRSVARSALRTARGCPFGQELGLTAVRTAIGRNQNLALTTFGGAGSRYAVSADDPDARTGRSLLALRTGRPGRPHRAHRTRGTGIALRTLGSRGAGVALGTLAASCQARKQCQCNDHVGQAHFLVLRLPPIPRPRSEEQTRAGTASAAPPRRLDRCDGPT